MKSFCQFQDLQHPNEFIRGSTLRFLCKLKESELLEPLMPAIRACLEHRHSYVRRNAVLAIYTIYRYKLFNIFCAVAFLHMHIFLLHSLVNKKKLMLFICFRNFEHLIPDAPELIHDFLVNEKDASCKRNAFMMLIHADQVCSIWSIFLLLLLLCATRPTIIYFKSLIYVMSLTYSHFTGSSSGLPQHMY